MSTNASGVEKDVLNAMERSIMREDIKTVIGWRKGSLGFRTRPLLAFEKDELKDAVYNPLCASNPATYLHLENDEKPQLKRGESPDTRKTAIVLRGCESRSLIVQLQEHVVPRESIHVIGVPCQGVVDRKLLLDLLGGEPSVPWKIEWRGSELVLTLDGREQTLPSENILLSKCRQCSQPVPLIYDELIEAPSREPSVLDYSDVNIIEEMEPGNRFDFWQGQFERCIRCNACRNACPQCSCPDCILERLEPNWVRRENVPVETWLYHFTRAYHLIGRCTYCGECERACPMDIPLLLIYKKIQKEALDMFNFEAGMKLEDEPLFSRAVFAELEEFGED